MKSVKLMWITVIAVRAMPTSAVRLVGQDKQANKHNHYKLIDVGTLGGRSEHVGWRASSQQPWNSRGLRRYLHPESQLSELQPISLTFGGDPFILHTFKFDDGRVTDMGALPGANSSCESFLTDEGLIVGGSENGLIDPLTGWPAMEAVAWKNGQVTNLGTFGGNGVESLPPLVTVPNTNVARRNRKVTQKSGLCH